VLTKPINVAFTFNVEANLFYDYIINGNEIRKEKSNINAFWKVGRVDVKDLEMAGLGG
jgi:hypothetical protein